MVYGVYDKAARCVEAFLNQRADGCLPLDCSVSWAPDTIFEKELRIIGSFA